MAKTHFEAPDDIKFVTVRHHDDGIVEIRLDRQRKLNAINAQMMGEMVDVTTQLSLDPPAALVITSAGNRAFSIGMDLRWESWQETQDDPNEDDPRFHQHVLYGQRVTKNLDRLAAPVIAAVHGDAYGAGLEFAISADLLIAGESTQVGLPEIKHGILPGGGATQMLPLLIGESRTKEMIFTGDRYDATEVAEWGLFNDVVSDKDVEDTAFELATTFAGNERGAFQAIKESIRATRGRIDLGREREVSTFDRTIDSFDPTDKPFT